VASEVALAAAAGRHDELGQVIAVNVVVPCAVAAGDVRTDVGLFSPPPGRAPPPAKTKVARRARR
jgi:hypothetical protein